ncbi:MAG: hypothetical protein RR425_04470 [Erysipelotrichales bacterium]
MKSEYKLLSGVNALEQLNILEQRDNLSVEVVSHNIIFIPAIGEVLSILIKVEHP